MNADLRIDRLRWWHLPTVARMEIEIFGPEAWGEGLLWTELSAGHDYRAVFDRAPKGGAPKGGAASGGASTSGGASPEEERIAGYAGTAFGDNEAWINNIAVDPAYRRRGVARALMDDLLARARAGGAKSVFLEVAVDNVPAQRLYDAYGFVGLGVRKNYYQHTGTDAAVMRMDL